MKLLLGITTILATAVTGLSQEAFELPTDDSVPVFTFDYSGGFRMRPPEGFVRQPQLQIFPDGRVLRSPNMPDLPSAEITISEEKLNEFLDAVVNQHKFYEIDAQEIKDAIEKTGKPLMIADAPNLDVAINLGQGTHEVRLYAASFAATQHPDIEPLADLVAIEKLSRRLVAVANLGGYDRLDRAVEQVNLKLANEHPEIPAFNEDQLQFASKNIQGVTTATFSAKVVSEEKSAVVRASYSIKNDGKEEVRVDLYPVKK